MIEVPLSEAMKHVQPQAFRRRTDQRKVELPKSAPQLFGDRKNPFAMAPTEEEPEPEVNGHDVNGHVADHDLPHTEEVVPPPRAVPLAMPKAVAPATPWAP